MTKTQAELLMRYIDGVAYLAAGNRYIRREPEPDKVVLETIRQQFIDSFEQDVPRPC